MRSGLSTLSSPSLEGQWNPDPFEFAPGNISPTSDQGRILRPLTLGLIWKPAHWPFYQLKLLAHALVISEIRMRRVHSQALQKAQGAEAPDRKNHLGDVLGFDSR